MFRTHFPLVSLTIISTLLLVFLLSGCGKSATQGQQEAPSVTFITTDTVTASTQQEYSAALEGKVNIEIRAQVEGYLEKILVDEGEYVTAGQPLFKINDLPYQEQLNNAEASLRAAEAALFSAELEVNKLSVLTSNKVVSEVQLKTAQSTYKAAQAGVEQAKAAVALAKINLGYTLIKAPVSGYIGRIPKRIGGLVSRMDQEALTLLSDITDVYAYFSMSEVDFMAFHRENRGSSVPEKIKNMLPVSLLLADGTIYEHTGRIEMVDGQFDKNTGSISVRATFPNPEKFLRSGNTGKVLVNRVYGGVIRIPQEATTAIQDKVFVFAIGDSNKVSQKPIVVTGKSGGDYLVSEGIAAGDKIVTGGMERLQEGMVIIPQPASSAELVK